MDSAFKIHGNLYNYDEVNYINSHTKVKINCKKHGIFLQTPLIHITAKAGCPKCKTSRGEKSIIKFLDENKIIYEYQKKFDDFINVGTKKKLSFDFYLPNHKMCIEFDGKQHFVAVKYFNGEKGLAETKRRDNMREEYCKSKNIKLIRIRYDEDIDFILRKNLNIM